MLNAVTFDCWGTLIRDRDFASATAARVEVLVELAGGRLDPAAAGDLLDRAWREHHAAWLEGRQYGSVGIARWCGEALGLDDDATEVLRERIEDAGRHGQIEALPGAVDTLRHLRERGIATALVCDAGMTPGRIVREYLDDLGLLSYLGYCAFSNEVGVPKPDARIFQVALERIGATARTAVHVGDLLRTDIDGGRAIGMRTIRIVHEHDDAVSGVSWGAGSTLVGERPPPDRAHGFEEADEVVRSHAELLRALRRLGAPLETIPQGD